MALKAYQSNINFPPISVCYTNGQEPQFHNILQLNVSYCSYRNVLCCVRERFLVPETRKTDWRSTLSTDQLNHLMLVLIEGLGFTDGGQLANIVSMLIVINTDHVPQEQLLTL